MNKEQEKLAKLAKNHGVNWRCCGRYGDDISFDYKGITLGDFKDEKELIEQIFRAGQRNRSNEISCLIND